MKRVLFTLILFCAACGDDPQTAPECREVEDNAFAKDGGWGAADYCQAPTMPGCFPFFGATKNSCKSFQSMRTEKTTDTSVQACKSLMSAINCNLYENDETGDNLKITVEDEGQLKINLFGSLDGVDVNTSVYLNPCQSNCLSGITLKTIAPDQQKICEIPRQGLPECLFPETAHNITFRQADANRVNVVLSGKDHLLTKK